MASFQLDWRYVEAASRTTNLELRSRHEVISGKIRSVAERLLITYSGGRSAGVGTEMLWLALARSVGSVFGSMKGKPSDAWLNPHALQRVVELIEANIATELTVKSMAEAAGLSASAFLRAFRGSTGMTPAAYLLERRMTKGAELLSTTALPISTIARRSGFKSSSHFTTTFAERRGSSPTRYRRAFGEPSSIG